MDPTDPISSQRREARSSPLGLNSSQSRQVRSEDADWRAGEQAAEIAKQWRAACESGQFPEASQLRNKLDGKLTLLNPHGQELCRKVARGGAAVVFDAEDLWQEVLQMLPVKLASYQSGNFGGWLWRVALNKHHDLARRFKHPGHQSLTDLSEPPHPASLPTAVQREVDEERLRRDLAAYLDEPGSPERECREMLVIAGGLDAADVGAGERDGQNAGAAGSSMITRLRLNRYLMDCADAEILRFPSDAAKRVRIDRGDLAEQERAYDRCLKRHQNKAAQNINRNFWSLLIRPPVWNATLRSIPIVSVDPRETPDINTMFLLLLFDAWIVLENAEVWTSWMRQHGIVNNSRRNFVRLWSVSPCHRVPPGSTDERGSRENGHSDLTVNPAKFDIILNHMLPTPGEVASPLSLSDLQPSRLGDFFQRLAEGSSQWFELIRTATQYRAHVDLPIPFRKIQCDVAAI